MNKFALTSLGLIATSVALASPPTSQVDRLMHSVPSTAKVVISINLQPGPRQKQVFQLLAPFVSQGLTSLSQSDDVPEDMKGLVKSVLTQDLKGAIAFGVDIKGVGKSHQVDPGAALKDLSKAGRYGVLLPISNQGKIDRMLAQLDVHNNTVPRYWNGARYHVMGPVNVMTLPHELVIASDKMLLAQIKRTSKGGKNFTQTSGYAMARKRYDQDATILVLTRLGSDREPWGGGSLTLRDSGVSLSIGPFSEGVAKGTALPSTYASTVPKGAYAVLAFSESATAFPSTTLGAMPQIPSFMRGQSLGAMTMALYPSSVKAGKSSGADLLMELAGSKKANPARLFTLGLKMAQKSLMGGMQLFSPAHFKGATSGGTLQKALRDSALGSLKGEAADEDSGMTKQMLAELSKKTLCYAKVGRSILVSTSKALMQRAVTAMTTHAGSMDSDPTLGQVLKSRPGKTYFLLTGDLKRIGDGLVSMMGQKMASVAAIMKIAPAPATLRLYRASGGAMVTLYMPLTPLMVGTIGLSSLSQSNGSN